MAREFGSRPADLVAAVGPCLDVCCGEVGDEVVEAFRAAGHARAGDRALVQRRTRRAGSICTWPAPTATSSQSAGLCAVEHIHEAGLCTRSFPDLFHSYRAAGPNAGRMAALIRCHG